MGFTTTALSSCIWWPVNQLWSYLISLSMLNIYYVQLSHARSVHYLPSIRQLWMQELVSTAERFTGWVGWKVWALAAL